MIHLDDPDLTLLKKILKVFAPEGSKVMAFGSRVTGIRLKRYSDIDLCLMGDTPVSSRALTDLQDAFANSNLTIRVDVIDWASTDPSFRAIIEPQFEEIVF